MSAVTFDTFKFAQILRDKAKLTTEHAEGISEAFANSTGEQLATKTDIKEFELKMDTRFKELQLTIGGMIAALGGVLIAVKFFGH